MENGRKPLLSLVLGLAAAASALCAEIRAVPGEGGFPVDRSVVDAKPGALSPAASDIGSISALPSAVEAAPASVDAVAPVPVSAAVGMPEQPAADGAGRESASAALGSAAAGAPGLDPGARKNSLFDHLRDERRYIKSLARSFWWYTYTHIGDADDPRMWPGYKARWRKARDEGVVVVPRPRKFFTAMRVTGMSGRFYELGPSALEDDLVIEEFGAAFSKYFRGPGVGAAQRESFDRLMARAKGFNAGNRANANMYKNIRDPLIEASTMRPDAIATFFDSKLSPEKEREVRDFQETGRMDRVREEFERALRETLDEEDPNDPLRVRAGIILGSFAAGSAGPGSDFDVEAVVNGADNARVPAFSKRLKDRWRAAGRDQTNPVTVKNNATWASWGYVNRVQTRPYIVVSREPALAARLSRRGLEKPTVTIERRRTARGRFNRAVQYALVKIAIYASNVKAWLGVEPPASGR